MNLGLSGRGWLDSVWIFGVFGLLFRNSFSRSLSMLLILVSLRRLKTLVFFGLMFSLSNWLILSLVWDIFGVKVHASRSSIFLSLLAISLLELLSFCLIFKDFSTGSPAKRPFSDISLLIGLKLGLNVHWFTSSFTFNSLWQLWISALLFFSLKPSR